MTIVLLYQQHKSRDSPTPIYKYQVSHDF